MSEQRLIDANAFKEDIIHNREIPAEVICDVLDIIDNAPTVDDKYIEGHIDGMLQAEKLYARPIGKWEDYSDEGYVECPFCGSLTTCDDNKDELHYCWNCGAELR